jgi:hypothetical protein
MNPDLAELALTEGVDLSKGSRVYRTMPASHPPLNNLSPSPAPAGSKQGSYCGFLDSVSGLFHGEGTMTWPSGDVFEGSWSHGRPLRGALRSPGRQVKYVGAFKDGLFEDEDATLIHNDAAAYRGGFRKGLYEGRGELSDERET